MTDQWAGKGFGWQNMFTTPEDDPRGDPAPTRGERDTLTSYLRFQRQTLEMKCDGLDAAQLSNRSVPTSELTLLGLIRHMAAVEHGWFQRVMQGDAGPRPFRPHGVHSEEFALPAPSQRAVEEAFEEWHRQCAAADDFIAESELEVRGADDIELREVLVHMIEEYARHLGHADLIREALDGRRGQ